jgi:5'(3')-deoxyribonucleotidase
VIVFMDLDGVFVNLPKAVANIFGHDWDQMFKNWTPGNPDMEIELKISKSKFWKEINRYPSFWEDLEPYDHMYELLDILRGCTLKILTSPSTDVHCASGKMRWIKKYMPHMTPHTILCRDKFLLAQRGRVLLDDTDKQIAAWDNTESGAYSITFPQPWNKNYAYVDCQLDFVREQLNLIKENYNHQVQYAD